MKRTFRGQHSSSKHSGQADGIVAHINVLLDLTGSFYGNLTNLQRQQVTKKSLLLSQSISNLPYNVSSQGTWDLSGGVDKPDNKITRC